VYKKRTIVCQILLITSVSFLHLGVAEAKVYRWVDEKGVVHYGDRPSEGVRSQVVQTTKSPKKDKFAEERLKRQLQYIDGLEEKQPPPKSAEDRIALAEKTRKDNCKQVQENLKVLQNIGRVFKENENSERVYLSDAEKAEEIKVATSQVAEFCK